MLVDIALASSPKSIIYLKSTVFEAHAVITTADTSSPKKD
jgi:hypothetical protein